MRIVFYEAEPTRSQLVLVEAHNDALDFADFRKELPDLFLAGEEGQITDIDGRGRV